MKAVFAAAWILSVHGALAAGAIAVGEPPDVAKQGLAVGIAVNKANDGEASAAALVQCRAYQGAPQGTRDLCKVVKAFSTMCVSTAYDPEPSTPGWGYGVGFTKFTAQDEAMQNCRTKAGVDRARFCKTETTMCDTQ